MRAKLFSYFSKGDRFIALLSVVFGILLVVGSVLATTIGDNITVSGKITVSGEGTSTIAGKLGVGTTSPEVFFSVGGSGGNTSGHVYITGGLGIARATTTSGVIQATGLILGEGNLALLGTGTSTFDGSLLVKGSSGIASAAGLTLAGTIRNTSTATSTFSGSIDALNLTSQNSLSVATATPAQEVSIVGDTFQSSDATTSIRLFSTSPTQGGCIQLEMPDPAGAGGGNRWVRIYAGSGTSTTGTEAKNAGGGGVLVGLVVEVGECQ